MRESAAPAPVRFGGGGGLAIGATLIGLLALLWLLGSGERELHRSATGFAGLPTYLEEAGLDARAFRGGGYLVRGEVGLRILPLHDTDLVRDRDPPETPEDVAAQTSERDMTPYVVAAKIDLLPTLLILPKWRTGMRALGVAHRELLIPEGELARLVGQIRGLRGHVRRDPSGYNEIAISLSDARIGLHHPQTIRASGCEPLIGTAREMLLGRCSLPGNARSQTALERHFWILADPDLMNNHGLTRAGNATVALGVVHEIAAGLPVVLDLSDEVRTLDPEQEPAREESEWQEFARLFAWPFTVVWFCFAVLAALVFWRAVTRFGPIERLFDDTPRAAKEVSIDAKARLLRLARHDRALLAIHIQHRLQQLAADLAGPQLRAGADPLAVLDRLIGSRAPELAEELAGAARLPQRRRDHSGVLLRHLHRFEKCLTRIRDEFGRAAVARR